MSVRGFVRERHEEERSSNDQYEKGLEREPENKYEEYLSEQTFKRVLFWFGQEQRESRSGPSEGRKFKPAMQEL